MSIAPFRRIACLLALAAGMAACTTLNAVSAWLGNEVAFTAPQLQRKLDNSFPRDFDKLGGLVSARLANPRLSIPQGDHRLRLDFDIAVSALGETPVDSGHFALLSGLRYNPATQGLHLDDPELLSVDVPGAGSLLKGGTRGLINTLLADYAASEPVYRLDDDLLRKLPAGKRIGSTNIENGHVVVRLTN